VTQRVVLVSPYALSVYGGVQEQVLAMSRVLAKRGDDVLVIAPDARDHTAYDTSAKVLRLGPRVSMPANGSRAPLTLSPVAAWRAKDAVTFFRPDVVHVHEPFAPLLSWVTLLAHEYPTVGTFHRSGDGPALRYTRPLIRHLATRLDDSVAVSGAAAETVERAAGVKSEVFFNGFETERFIETLRERSVETVLFYIGRLEQRKGVATAIEATREHNAKPGVPWRLVIGGDGPERARLEALAARDPRVIFLGRISDAEKRSWMRRVHVLVAPSTHGESFGLVLLEGMASETLVVASDIDGYREAADGHATLFHPGDAASLERAVLYALEGETDEKLAAARDYAQRWSMSRLMDKYQERYDLARRRFSNRELA
jgi:phosphatidyl-myo-inositol alpha-mannosyltransferase